MRAWESNIRKVVPYVPGEQPKGDRLIKFWMNSSVFVRKTITVKMAV